MEFEDRVVNWRRWPSPGERLLPQVNNMSARRSNYFAWIAAGLLCTAALQVWPANGQLVRMERAELRLAADRTAYAPGDEARIAAIVAIEPGWHVNSNLPTYDFLIATEVTVRPPADWPPPERIVYPVGEMKTFAFADEAISVYEGTALIEIHTEVPETVHGEVSMAVDLRYQACDDKSCLPPVTTSAELALRIGERGRPQNTELFGDRTDGAAAPRGAPLAWILLLGVLGGLILNAMPCVLPVLSLKLFGLVQSAGHGRREVVTGALATTAGIVVSFWGLALAAILARAGGAAIGWGVQFQEPAFVATLTVVVLLFCLNLWGIFEIPLPGRLAGVASSGPSQGIAGHFSSGLFATLMATPCSAPFLGTAVGFGLSQPAGTILLVFTAVAVGMSLPYLLLAIAPQAVSWLPKPGAWMVSLRVVLGFLLAGAAVWLLYVLSAQISPERLAFFEIALLGMALFVWAKHRAARPAAGRVALVAVVIAAGVAIFLAASGSRPESRGAVSSELIAWVAFDRTEAERLAAAGTPVFVDVTADWCFTCKVNERLVLETQVVADAFERFGVVPMKADWTNRSNEIAEFLAAHGRYGIPFYLLYRADGEAHLFGELLTTEEVLKELATAGGTRAADFQ